MADKTFLINSSVNDGLPYLENVETNFTTEDYISNNLYNFRINTSNYYPIESTYDLQLQSVDIFDYAFSLGPDSYGDPLYLDGLQLQSIYIYDYAFSLGPDKYNNPLYIDSVKDLTICVTSPLPNSLFQLQLDESSMPQLGCINIEYDPLSSELPLPSDLYRLSIKNITEINHVYEKLDEPIYIIDLEDQKPDFFGAFYNSKIENIDNPKSVKVIGNKAFMGSNLNKIAIAKDTKFVNSSFPKSTTIEFIKED